MAGQGLSTSERVRRRVDFERIYSEGVRVRGRFMTVFVRPNEGATARLGVAATRKIGTAVVRNRTKRLAREIFRRCKPPVGVDVVIVPRVEMLNASFSSLEKEFRGAIERRGRERPRAKNLLRPAHSPLSDTGL